MYQPSIRSILKHAFYPGHVHLPCHLPLGIQQRRSTAAHTAFSCCIPVYILHTLSRAACRGIQLYSGLQYTALQRSTVCGGLHSPSAPSRSEKRPNPPESTYRIILKPDAFPMDRGWYRLHRGTIGHGSDAKWRARRAALCGCRCLDPPFGGRPGRRPSMSYLGGWRLGRAQGEFVASQSAQMIYFLPF